MNAARLELLARHAPGMPVARGPGGVRTAQDLVRDAEALATRLPAAFDGSEVLVICGDRYHFAVGLLAAWRAGHGVALPPNGQRETVHALAAQAHVTALVHDTDDGEGIDVRSSLGPGGLPEAEAPRCSFESQRHLASVYTSGTTGAYQSFRKTAAQLVGEAALLARTFDLDGDTVLGTVPPHHIYGLLFTVLLPLASGGCMVRSTPLLPEVVAREAREHGATVLVAVPAHLRAIAALPDDALPGVRRVFSSGAPLDDATATRVERFGASVVDVLGSTETGGIAHRRPATEATWTTFADVRVTTDEDGALLVESPLLGHAAERPFRTGDRIELGGAEVAHDADVPAVVRFRHLGRVDGVVKVAGKRLALPELEARLRSLPGVLDAAVGAVPVDGARGNEILAALVAPGMSLPLVRQALLAWFDPVVLPRRWRTVDALPREANGKLTKARFLALFQDPREFDVHERRTVPDAKADVRTVALRVPPDLAFLRGHFAGFPILAGVVQLNNLVLKEARRAWPGLAGLRRIRRLKFRLPIRPNDELVLRLEREPGSAQVAFRIDRGTSTCCVGTLGFEEHDS